MNGGSGSVAFNFNRWLSGVADFGGYHNRADGTISTFLMGPRISFNREGRITPFGQALLGGAHAGNTYLARGASQTAFSTAVGGGLDWRFTNHIRIRAAEVDYLLTHFTEVVGVNTRVQNNLRVSTGVVVRF
jgi:opacity protein-like surface antigen